MAEKKMIEEKIRDKECNQGWEYYGAGIGGWGTESDWRCRRCGKIAPYCVAHETMCSNKHQIPHEEESK